MSARVNLLPPEIAQRARARKATSWTIMAVLLYAALLVVLYIGKLASVNAAEEQRAQEAATVAALEVELAQLQQYAELDRQVAAREELLEAAMATEVSWARIMNDLALTFPASSSMTTFGGLLEGATEAGASGTPPNPNSESIGTVAFEGYSVEQLSPGVERVLIKFDEVDTFFNAYLTEATEEERNNTTIMSFNGTFQLNDKAYTNRYAEGLPPEVNP
jgi:hypothetical protein